MKTFVSGVLFGSAAILVIIRNSVGMDTVSNPLNWLGSIIFPSFRLPMCIKGFKVKHC